MENIRLYKLSELVHLDIELSEGDLFDILHACMGYDPINPGHRVLNYCERKWGSLKSFTQKTIDFLSQKDVWIDYTS